jgi:hypothetical protein
MSELSSERLAWCVLVLQALTLVVTALYVLFTYRLMRAAVAQSRAANDAASVALRQLEGERIGRVGPMVIAVASCLEGLSTWRTYWSDEVQHRDDILAGRPPLQPGELFDAYNTAGTMSLALHGVFKRVLELCEQLEHIRVDFANAIGGQPVVAHVVPPGPQPEMAAASMRTLTELEANLVRVLGMLQPLLPESEWPNYALHPAARALGAQPDSG